MKERIKALNSKIEEIVPSDHPAYHIQLREFITEAKGLISDPSRLEDEDLELIDKEIHGALIRRIVLKDDPQSRIILPYLFVQISELNIIRGSITEDLKYYTDAAAAAQYVLNVINYDGELSAEQTAFEGKAYALLTDINKRMMELCHTRYKSTGAAALEQDHDLQVIDKGSVEAISNKQVLDGLREYVNLKIPEIDRYSQDREDANYIASSQELYSIISTIMQQYLASLFKAAQDQIGAPPFAYAVIGLGSIALGTITPYSDLEFAIITEQSNAPDQEEDPIKTRKFQYFTDLTHLVHFKVICLGETIIATSQYGIDLSRYGKRAVKFDFGGKTPLGRIKKDKDYTLIGDIDHMIKYARNTNDEVDGIDKNLTTIIQKACYMYGAKYLHEAFALEVHRFLRNEGCDQRMNATKRANKVLIKGTREKDDSSSGSEAEHRAEGNLTQFKLDPSLFGRVFDVKQEIYRIPDRFIYYLGLLYNIQGDSVWDTIDKLYTAEHICEEACINLKKASSFATILRLKVYSHYGCQNDTVACVSSAADESSGPLAKQFHLNPDDLLEDRGLFEFFYTMLALQRMLEIANHLGLLSQFPNGPYFKGDPFYQDNSETKAGIYIRLGNSEKALEYTLKTLKKMQNSGSTDYKKMLMIQVTAASLCGWQEQYTKGLECILSAKKYLEKAKKEFEDIEELLPNKSVEEEEKEIECISLNMKIQEIRLYSADGNYNKALKCAQKLPNSKLLGDEAEADCLSVKLQCIVHFMYENQKVLFKSLNAEVEVSAIALYICTYQTLSLIVSLAEKCKTIDNNKNYKDILAEAKPLIQFLIKMCKNLKDPQNYFKILAEHAHELLEPLLGPHYLRNSYEEGSEEGTLLSSVDVQLDGTTQDLPLHIRDVKYSHSTEKMPLGEKATEQDDYNQNVELSGSTSRYELDPQETSDL